MNSEDELRAELDAALQHDSSDGYSTPDGRLSRTRRLASGTAEAAAVAKSMTVQAIRF